MNQTEKEQKQAELRALMVDHQTKAQMLEDEIRALEAIPVKQKFKVWEPEEGGRYFRTHLLDFTRNNNDSADSMYLELGFAHPTKEAAERHHSFLVMLHDLHKFAVEHNEGWKPNFLNFNQMKYLIEYEVAHGKLTLLVTETYRFNCVLPVFKSMIDAQKAIDTFGDRLKILFEYYNS